MNTGTNFMTEKQDFSKFGASFQDNLVQLMLEDRSFCDQFLEVVDVNYFELKYQKVFVEKIIEYRNKYNTHPTSDTIVTILRTGLDKESEVTQRQVRDFYSRIEAKEFSKDGVQFIKDQALDFCRKQKLKEAMIKCVGLIQNSSFDEISKTMTDALRLGADNNYGHDYMLDFEKRFVVKARNPVTTGWETIDLITKGGLGKGELGVAVAPTGAGKSMLLVHLGAAALLQGLNVVHYTLELSDTVVASRYDSCVTGVPISSLLDSKELIYDTVSKVKGKLIVKEYPTKSASTNTIKNHLERLRRSGFKIDMVIVDYGDLLRPMKAEKDKRIELESIYEELRGLAQIMECPIYTASQTNRSGLNAEVVTMESISEAFNKCFVADFIFSLSRTAKDKQTNQGRIFVAKNRNGPDGLVFPIFMDTSNVSIKVLEQSKDDAETFLGNASKKQEESLKEKYKTFRKERNKKDTGEQHE